MAEADAPVLPQPTPEEVLIEAAFYGWLSDEDQSRRWLRAAAPA